MRDWWDGFFSGCKILGVAPTNLCDSLWHRSSLVLGIGELYVDAALIKEVSRDIDENKLGERHRLNS